MKGRSDVGDIKQIRRLATAATFEYSDGPGGVPALGLADHKDGGTYDIHPLISYDGDTALLLLPHPSSPAYSAAIRVTADTAGRLGRALVGIQRTLEGSPPDEASE